MKVTAQAPARPGHRGYPQVHLGTSLMRCGRLVYRPFRVAKSIVLVQGSCFGTQDKLDTLSLSFIFMFPVGPGPLAGGGRSLYVPRCGVVF